MRYYYCFEIKEELIGLYQNNPKILYQMLRQIYYLNKNELNYGKSLINQLIKPIDKYKIDQKLFLILHQKMVYSKQEEIHIINDMLHDEISRLKIKNTYILIRTNKNYSSFFQYLTQFSNNYFVCDFKWNDYFFLSSIKMLV